MFKKLIIATIAVLLMNTPIAHSAMTCTETLNKWGSTNPELGKRKATLVLVCTANTSPATSVYTVSTNMMKTIEGMYAYTFLTRPGTTGPTDDSSLAIVDSLGSTYLYAAGNGASVVDNATVTQNYFDYPNSGANGFPMMKGLYPITLTVTDNIVNNSSFTLYIDLVD